ncbi:phage baseplate assembly protein [Hansschlegelia zhihuaiae]|uniref:phage baseplate assembly protein n=1 Tax=Hansschlegelia zhihuaiae TaxID=405005 RepID=UPI0013E8D7B3|nr:hypothetical protein [Hansschlegelia zhihuaiae]
MSAVAEIVTMVVDGYALQGWQSVRVSRSVEAAAIAFSLDATNPAWSAEAQRIRESALVEIVTTPDGAIGSFLSGGGDLLCAGYVDVYSSSHGPGPSRRVAVQGRSKPADAIDCEPARHPTGCVEGQDLVGAAKSFDEWGLEFRSDVDLEKVPVIQRVPGEPLFGTLEREARRQGLFLMGEPDGSVLMTRGPAGRAGGGLVEGQSPLRAFQVHDSQRLAFSEVVVRGQQALGTDDKALRQEERAEDQSYGRRRPLVLFNEGSSPPEQLGARAQWELRRRNGARLTVMASVATWRDDAGALWAPRKRVFVHLPSEDISEDLAIQAVEFTQGVGEGEGAGTIAELTLVRPDTLGDAEGAAG